MSGEDSCNPETLKDSLKLIEKNQLFEDKEWR